MGTTSTSTMVYVHIGIRRLSFSHSPLFLVHFQTLHSVHAPKIRVRTENKEAWSRVRLVTKNPSLRRLLLPMSISSLFAIFRKLFVVPSTVSNLQEHQEHEEEEVENNTFVVVVKQTTERRRHQKQKESVLENLD